LNDTTAFHAELNLSKEGNFTIDRNHVMEISGTWEIKKDSILILKNSQTEVEWLIKHLDQDSLVLFFPRYEDTREITLKMIKEN
jgi:hypothetical protein